jgi:transposase-like protein
MAKTSSADRRRHWQGVIDRQRASNESITRFCAEAGVSTASFYTWRRKLRLGSRRTRRPSLVPVRIVSDEPERSGRLEVQWPSGVVMRVGAGCDAQTVSLVMSNVLAAEASGEPNRC